MSERTARHAAWRPLLAAAFLYTACALALLWPAITDGNMLSAGSRWVTTGPFPLELREQVPPGIDILSDSSNAYVPYMLFAAHNWAHSHALPLWKDTACCGAPFFGNGESALLFPTNLIALLIGTPTWIHGAMALVKLVAAALGAWALARHLGMSFLGALLAGAVWGFGGMQSAFLLYTPTNVSLLLPWLLLACDRFAREPAARIIRDLPNALTVAIAPRGAAWLVVSDTFYPGWKAFVDGVQRPIERANVAFRAVAVGPQDGIVTFRYQPDSFIAGALISLLAGLAAGITLVRSRRRPAGAAPHDAGNDPRAAG